MVMESLVTCIGPDSMSSQILLRNLSKYMKEFKCVILDPTIHLGGFEYMLDCDLVD